MKLEKQELFGKFKQMHKDVLEEVGEFDLDPRLMVYNQMLNLIKLNRDMEDSLMYDMLHTQLESSKTLTEGHINSFGGTEDSPKTLEAIEVSKKVINEFYLD